MELTANSFELHPVQIKYFKELNSSSFKVVLFDEETVYDCLKEVLNISTEEANRLLGYAVKEVCRYKAKTSEIIENMDKHRSLKLKSTNPGNRELFSTFFGMPEHGKWGEQYCRGVNSYMHNSTYNNPMGGTF